MGRKRISATGAKPDRNRRLPVEARALKRKAIQIEREIEKLQDWQDPRRARLKARVLRELADENLLGVLQSTEFLQEIAEIFQAHENEVRSKGEQIATAKEWSKRRTRLAYAREKLQTIGEELVRVHKAIANWMLEPGRQRLENLLKQLDDVSSCVKHMELAATEELPSWQKPQYERHGWPSMDDFLGIDNYSHARRKETVFEQKLRQTLDKSLTRKLTRRVKPRTRHAIISILLQVFEHRWVEPSAIKEYLYSKKRRKVGKKTPRQHSRS